jgi:hypothetical protein
MMRMLLTVSVLSYLIGLRSPSCFHVSCFSLKLLAEAGRPLMQNGGHWPIRLLAAAIHCLLAVAAPNRGRAADGRCR